MSDNRAKGVLREHIPCISPTCESTDALAVYEKEDGSVDGYCWSCDTYFPNPYQDEKEYDKEHQPDMKYDMEVIKHFPSLELKYKGIRQDIAEKYGVKVEISRTSGEDVAYYFPRTKDKRVTGYQKRTLPKTFTSVGDTRDCELFGRTVCGEKGKLLIITEGNEDCLAAFQMLRDLGKNYRVCSLPNGANSKSIKTNLNWVESFETVILALDQDDKGEKAAKEISDLLTPGRARIAHFSEKDASDMLKEGKGQEFLNSLFNASDYSPEGVVTVDDVFDKATSMPEYGRAWPWPTLTNMTYGRRDGEGIYVGAGVKIGKSEFVNQMLQHIIEVEQNKVMVFKFEEEPSMTARRVAGKLKHKQFHKPDGDFTQEELMAGVRELSGKLLMYDTYHMESGKKWDRIKPVIRHAALVEGVKDFFFDPITNFTDGLSPSETDTELRRISNELAAMSKDLGFFYYCFCHLKAPESGAPHEEGGRVHSNQFRGSRAMMEKTYYMLGIERNKSPELPEDERNTSTFVLLEDRAFGQTGRFPVFYNNNTGDYLEPDPNSSEF